MPPRQRAKAAAEQWWAVVDGDGQVVSEGTVVANPLPSGLTKVKVDGPSNGRPWDPQAKAWGEPPEPPTPEPDPLAAIVPALGGIAADDSLDLTGKLTAMVEVLKQAAPAAPTPEDGA